MVDVYLTENEVDAIERGVAVFADEDENVVFVHGDTSIDESEFRVCRFVRYSGDTDDTFDRIRRGETINWPSKRQVDVSARMGDPVERFRSTLSEYLSDDYMEDGITDIEYRSPESNDGRTGFVVSVQEHDGYDPDIGSRVGEAMLANGYALVGVHMYDTDASSVDRYTFQSVEPPTGATIDSFFEDR